MILTTTHIPTLVTGLFIVGFRQPWSPRLQQSLQMQMAADKKEMEQTKARSLGLRTVTRACHHHDSNNSRAELGIIMLWLTTRKTRINATPIMLSR